MHESATNEGSALSNMISTRVDALEIAQRKLRHGIEEISQRDYRDEIQQL